MLHKIIQFCEVLEKVLSTTEYPYQGQMKTTTSLILYNLCEVVNQGDVFEKSRVHIRETVEEKQLGLRSSP